MKIVYKIISLLLIVIMVSVTSCRTIETGTTTTPSRITTEEVIFSKIVEQQPQYSTATIKCSVALEKLSSKAQIKIINGEYIQISLQPLLGIEMFRVMMTPDSLYVIDKINSLVARESIKEIKKRLPKGCGITELQKMILGIPFVVGDTLTLDKYSKFTWSGDGENNVEMSSRVGNSAIVSFKCNKQGVLQNTSIQYKSTDVLDCAYTRPATYSETNSQPSAISLNSNIPQLGFPLSVKLTNITTEWNKKVVKDTQVSSRYKSVSLQELIGKYIGQ